VLHKTFGSSSKPIQPLHLLTIALHHFVGNERERAALMDGDGMDGDGFSVRSGLSGMSTRTDRTRFLPHSRLRAMGSPLGGGNGSSAKSGLFLGSPMVRRDSIRRSGGSPSSVSPSKLSGHVSASPLRPIPEDSALQPTDPLPTRSSLYPVEQQEGFRALARMRASEVARQLQLVQGPGMAADLLAMEQALLDPVTDVDVVSVHPGPMPSWDAFESAILGKALEPAPVKTSTEVPSTPTAPKIAMSTTLHKARLAMQGGPLAELFDRERSYARGLSDCDRLFVQDLPQRRFVQPHQQRILFDGISDLARLHSDLMVQLDEAKGDLVLVAGKGDESGREDRSAGQGDDQDRNLSQSEESGSSSTCDEKTTQLVRIMQVLLKFFRDEKGTFRSTYGRYCGRQDERTAGQKEELERNQSFYQFCEQAYSRGLRDRLDQLLMSPIQRLTRYPMHLTALIQHCHPSDTQLLSLLLDAEEAARQLVRQVDGQKACLDERGRLMGLQNRIKGLPAGFTSGSSGRALLRSLRTMDIGNGNGNGNGGGGGASYVLYLLSDTLLVTKVIADAKKKESSKKKKGIIERVSSSASGSSHTEELLVNAPLTSSSPRISAERPASLIQISLPHDTTHQPFFRLQVCDAMEQEEYQSTLGAFMAEWEGLQAGISAGTSCAAKVYSTQGLRFHVHAGMESYQASPHHHGIALLYLENGHTPTLDALPAACRALAIVQARSNAFRALVRYRGPVLVSSPTCYTSSPATSNRSAMQQGSHMGCGLQTALRNAGLLLQVYPPFPPALLAHRQHQLGALLSRYVTAESSLGGMAHRLKASLTRKLHGSKSGSGGGGGADGINHPDEMAQRLWDASTSCLATSMDELSMQDEDEGDDVPRSAFAAPMLSTKTSGKTSKTPIPATTTKSPLAINK